MKAVLLELLCLGQVLLFKHLQQLTVQMYGLLQDCWVHLRQRSYMRAVNAREGLVLNFAAAPLEIRRVKNAAVL